MEQGFVLAFAGRLPNTGELKILPHELEKQFEELEKQIAQADKERTNNRDSLFGPFD